MKPLQTTRYLLLTTVFVFLPYRLETDVSGKLSLVASMAHAASGSGSDGDGGEGDGDGGEGGDDGGEGGDDGGEGGDDGGEGGEGGDDNDGDDGEGREGDDDGDDNEGGDDDFGERDDDEDDDESGRMESRATKAQKLANGARVFFSDGSREEIRDGRYVRTDRNGRVVERRLARSSDLARMRAIFGGNEAQSDTNPNGVNSRAIQATYRGQNVTILYSNGWREEITSGRYRLTDQYGRVVAARRATQEDRKRLNRYRQK